MITPLQILSSYTKQKAIHIFIFTLLYLRRIKPLQYINPPIIVRLPKRNGGLHPAAHFCVYGIYTLTNNAVSIKYRTQKIQRKNTYYNDKFLQLYLHVSASLTAGSMNPAAIYHVHTIYIPTNNAVPIKYRTKQQIHISPPTLTAYLISLL